MVPENPTLEDAADALNALAAHYQSADLFKPWVQVFPGDTVLLKSGFVGTVASTEPGIVVVLVLATDYYRSDWLDSIRHAKPVKVNLHYAFSAVK